MTTYCGYSGSLDSSKYDWCASEQQNNAEIIGRRNTNRMVGKNRAQFTIEWKQHKIPSTNYATVNGCKRIHSYRLQVDFIQMHWISVMICYLKYHVLISCFFSRIVLTCARRTPIAKYSIFTRMARNTKQSPLNRLWTWSFQIPAHTHSNRKILEMTEQKQKTMPNK